MNKLYLFFLLLFLYTALPFLNAQETSKPNLTYGIGYGYFQSTQLVNGDGKILSTGVEVPVWKDKIRFSPNLSIGFLNASSFYGNFDQWMNPINLDIPVSFDIVRLGSFSLQTSIGVFINNTQGYINYDYYTWDTRSIPRFRNFWAMGACANIGFRIMPKKWKVGIELTPIQVHYGFIDFRQFDTSMGIIVKL